MEILRVSKKIKALLKDRGCMRAMLSFPAYPFLQGCKHLHFAVWWIFVTGEERGLHSIEASPH